MAPCAVLATGLLYARGAFRRSCQTSRTQVRRWHLYSARRAVSNTRWLYVLVDMLKAAHRKIPPPRSTAPGGEARDPCDRKSGNHGQTVLVARHGREARLLRHPERHVARKRAAGCPPPELQAALGPSGLYGFGATIAHDTRDSQFLATEGHL